MYGGGGYVWISYYLCAIGILSLHNNRTTVDMPCPLMDGAYLFQDTAGIQYNNHQLYAQHVIVCIT